MSHPTLGPTPAPGDPVGPYRLESVLGSGGMATVYLARDARGAEVAIKVLNPARVPPEEVKRFTREFKALSRLDHENVVAVYETGVHDGYPWIAMEYVDGTELGAVIQRWRVDPPPDRYERIEALLRGLCHGLQYVHDAGMIHRDIKPGNILVSSSGQPKLSDFGVVTGDDTSMAGFTQLTMAGRLVGTVAFMAPELITAEDIDRRADLYALGAVLYMLCTYRRPIEANSIAGYLARHLTEVPRPITDYDPDAPAHLVRICQRLLLKDRAWRYPNATAVLQALDAREATDRHPLRGRDSVLELWNKRARRLEDGEGGVVAIHGARGSGRTHVLDQLGELARAQGWTVASAVAGPGSLAEALARSIDVEPRWGAIDLALELGPRAILVDDLDRATHEDVASLARVVRHHVVLEGQPLLLLFTASELEGRVATLRTGESTGIPAELWPLEPLELRPVIALLRDRGVTGRVAPILARRLHEDYAGQPGGIVRQLETLIEAGWFETAIDPGLRPLRGIDDFRKADLPVPREVQDELESQLGALDPSATEVVELLALLDRSATASLLARCAESPELVPGAIDSLERSEMVARATEEGTDSLILAHPCAGRVLRARIEPTRRRALHERIAAALSVRRRGVNALEVARHLRRAGEISRAWPLFLQAAKVAARAGQTSLVLEVTEEAAAVEPLLDSTVDPGELLRTRRWFAVLRGEALMARARWPAAVEMLEVAVQAARSEGDPEAIGRALGSLGRALYRSGQFELAEPLLVEALDRLPGDATTRASATRALADIRLREGRITESEQLWERAQALAMDQGSRDGEARARRGLGHLRCVQGRLEEAGELLEQADELLDPDGDDRVRAGVLARSVELETCAGRYGSALRRCESLVELVRRREMAERLPEAYALLAETLVALGDHSGAHDAAHQSLVFARANGPRTWDARIRAARALADLGRWDEVEAALPQPEDIPTRMVDDPAAQLAALRGRLYARTNTGKAADQATWALVRPPPLLAIRAVRTAVDASLALSRVGQIDAARDAVKRGLKTLDGPGADGLRLELLLAMQKARPDPRVVKALRQIAARIVETLSPDQAQSFLAREGVEEALLS